MPGGDLGLDVARRGDDGRPALQLPPRVDHAPVEVVDVLAHVALAGQRIDARGELGVLAAQQQRGRAEPGELLRLDLAADPPVRIMMIAEAFEGLARSRQIVELPAPDRLLDRRLDIQRPLVRIPRGWGGGHRSRRGGCLGIRFS